MIIVWILHIVVRLIGVVTRPIFQYVYEADRNKFRVPPSDNELLLKPATVLASMIRHKEVSKTSITKYY